MELTQIIVTTLQIFIVSTLTVIIGAYLVYRLRKRKPVKTLYAVKSKINTDNDNRERI